MEQVAPNIYAETKYESGNVGFIITDAGLVCVDVPMLPSDARDWRLQIAQVTRKPIITLIQTKSKTYKMDGQDKLRVIQELPDTESRFAMIEDLLDSFSD